MNKSIPSVCCIGGSGGGDSGASGGGGGSSPSMPTQQLSASTQQPGQQGQAIAGLTMPTLQDIMNSTGAGGGGFVNSPMPQSHGAANAAIMQMIMAML